MHDAPARGERTPARRPRLLLLTPDYPPERGGIQTLCERLASGFEQFDVSVLTLAPRSGEREEPGGALSVRRVRAGSSQRTRVAALNAAAAASLLASPPDVVLSAHCACLPATRAAQAVRRLPVLQYFHANEIVARPGLARRAADAADVAVCVSHYTEQLLRGTGAQPRRVELIPPGVDLHPTPRGPREPGAPPTLLTVARLRDAYKGHDTVLEALGAVRERFPEVRWWVIGEGPLRPALEERARALGLGGHVSFLGAVSDEERDRRMREADVFVMASRLPGGRLAGEGFGMVLMEAAAAGVPVVAGAAGGALDAVEDGVSGLLVDPADPAAVAEALIALLADPDRARRMGAAGEQRARGFAWPVICARVQGLLLELAARP